MIDFQNGVLVKLKQVDNDVYSYLVNPILLDSEKIIGTYKAIRDGVVFTNKRVISINVQGITGKKVDITSLPYSKISAFSCETAGVLDLDSELELWFRGLGKVKFEFTGKTNIVEINRAISVLVLG